MTLFKFLRRGTPVASLVVVALAVWPRCAAAQPDLTLFGEHMAGEDLYGIGGAFIVPIKQYSFDLVAGGQYFFADADTTSPWMVNFDIHANLFTYRFLRPYAGVGLNYYNRDGDDVGLNLKVGAYIRLRDRLIPYVQYTYRTIPSIDHSYVQIGTRILLRAQ